ncbi:MAG: YaaL family protein [Lachnospiraceae bacterium]|nr:YaaL family protein [Lachnospiraceae bacterium]MDD7024515.1 YaaL family protein [Oscillospiraceae bacterium]MDY5540071.1 YaaL family protein [Lachnospiraceae bacterium]MDY5648168.1 YaaL family protein [Lachnospiraceae bacterium]
MKYMTVSEYEKNLILAELKRTRQALDNAYDNFQNVVDPDLIDCYIYEVNAVQQKYKYLLKQAKQLL